MKKKILIIGGTGFIGHHLAKKCLKLNWETSSISVNKPKKERRLKKVKYLHCDISRYKDLEKNTKKDFNYVVNLGGYIDHNNKKKVYNSHFLGVKNLANIFLKKNIDSFVQMGSSAEYGIDRSPLQENFKCKPQMIYGKSKLKATKFLITLFEKKKFPVTILRPYQVYGPKQSINRFVPLLINACIKNIKFITSHGKQKRDFVYVDDLISAILKSLSSKKSKGKIINIGSGKPITLLKIMKTIQKKIGGGKLLFGKIKLRVDEPMIIFPNLTNSVKFLNWRSKVSFNTGINNTIKEYKKKIG